MDLKSKHSAPVLADPAPITKTRLGMHSSLLLYSPSPTILCRTISKKKIIPNKLDDVRGNGWLDSMASSSPPRKYIPKDFNFEVAKTDGPEAAYGSWMVIFSPSQDFYLEAFFKLQLYEISIYRSTFFNID